MLVMHPIHSRFDGACALCDNYAELLMQTALRATRCVKRTYRDRILAIDWGESRF